MFSDPDSLRMERKGQDGLSPSNMVSIEFEQTLRQKFVQSSNLVDLRTRMILSLIGFVRPMHGRVGRVKLNMPKDRRNLTYDALSILSG